MIKPCRFCTQPFDTAGFRRSSKAYCSDKCFKDSRAHYWKGKYAVRAEHTKAYYQRMREERSEVWQRGLERNKVYSRLPETMGRRRILSKAKREARDRGLQVWQVLVEWKEPVGRVRT